MSRNTMALASLRCLLVLSPVLSARVLDEIAGPSPDPAGCGIVCLDDNDEGRTSHLRRGELVLLRLRSNPSTGYVSHNFEAAGVTK
jgi:hypothetical protein